MVSKRHASGTVENHEVKTSVPEWYPNVPTIGWPRSELERHGINTRGTDITREQMLNILTGMGYTFGKEIKQKEEDRR